jgi:alanyl aminopeptidase
LPVKPVADFDEYKEVMMRKLIVICLFAALPAVAAPLRLARDVVPVRESITLKMDPNQDDYRGTVVIDLDVKKAVPSFSLHAEEMKIEKIAIDGVTATSSAGPEQTLVVTPGKPLKTGRATMTIDFSNEYDRRAVGLYKMVRKGDPYLFTQFEATDARKAFPVFDEPSFKIPYQLTATVPSAVAIIFNTPQEKETSADGWKTVTFAQTKPLPSYLLAIAAGALEFTPVPGTSIPTRIVTVKGQSGLTGIAVEQTPKVLAGLEKYFDSKYPFEKLDLIAVPEYWYGAMENPGLITYAENILLVDPKAVTPAQRRQNARITTHELAHMWFGDLVTMAWWDDLWLNESFADWMGDKVADEVYPQYGIAQNEIGNVQNIMNVDASPLTAPIRNKDASPEDAMRSVGLAYNKGKAVISMFERWLGPDQFRAGVIRHLKAHAWGNATAADFWAALGKQTAAPMNTFMDQSGLPLITAEVVAPNQVRLSQHRYLRAGIEAPAQTWIVPVALRYSDGSATRVKTVLLDAPSKTFTLDAPKVAWVFPHADASGYYRWNLPQAQFVTLASKATESLTPGERIAFLGNLGALLDAAVIHGNDYLDVIHRFSTETDPDVLGAVLSALGRVDAALSESDRPLFASYVRRTLSPVLERIGYTPKEGESQPVTILRPRLLIWVVDIGGDPKAVAWAKELAPKVVADPAAVHPSLVTTVLTVAAFNGGTEAEFEEYRKRFEAATVPAERNRYLAVLGAFRDHALREKAFAYTLGDKVRPNEMLSIPFSHLDTEEGRAYTFDWILRNYDAITARVPAQFRAGFPRLAGGCDTGRLAKARDFFFTPEHKVEGMEREMARTEEQVKECVAFRAREAETVRKFLADAAP